MPAKSSGEGQDYRRGERTSSQAFTLKPAAETQLTNQNNRTTAGSPVLAICALSGRKKELAAAAGVALPSWATWPDTALPMSLCPDLAITAQL